MSKRRPGVFPLLASAGRAPTLSVAIAACAACSTSSGSESPGGGANVDAAASTAAAPSSGSSKTGTSGTGASGTSKAGGGAGSSATASGTGSSRGSSSGGASSGSGSSGNASSGSVDAGAACVPSCANKTCGGDGCGGSCGGCPPTQMCSATGTCQARSASGIVVDATSQLTPISSDIYGVAFVTDTADDSYTVATLDRWGGDAEESYNWKKDLHNSGADWMCANYAGSGHDSDDFVQANKARHLNTLMTIPITGWLANTVTGSDTTQSSSLGQPLSYCDYPQLPDGGLLPGSTCCEAIGTQESIQVDKGSSNLDTSYMADWVSHLVSTFGSAAAGGVKYYQLDNEPDNWRGLRQDIYPALYPPSTDCVDYSAKIASGTQAGVSPNDDIINRSVAYAAAVKSADPTAQVLFLSVMNPDDMVNLMYTECGVGQSWGSQFAVPYSVTNSYAMAMMAKGKAYEAANHRRVFDCLDTHYPGPAQSMWTNTFSRFRGWIDSSYPGTGICVSEYNVSNDTTDATATTKEADYLGTFGVMGLRLAAYWTTLAPKSASGAYVHSYSFNAFAMYRNYDGAGGAFGNISVGAESAYPNVHAYAATDSATAPSKMWIMLVNTGTAAQTVSLTIDNFTAAASASVYQSVNGAAPASAPSVSVSNGAISGFSIAGNTVALLVLHH